RLSRYESALHYERHFGMLPVEALAGPSAYAIWADGSASLFFARALARHGEAAVAAAARIIGNLNAPARPGSRVARLTALRVLEAVASHEAVALLEQVLVAGGHSALRNHARAALRRLRKKASDNWGAPTAETLRELTNALLHGSDKDRRIEAL